MLSRNFGGRTARRSIAFEGSLEHMLHVALVERRPWENSGPSFPNAMLQIGASRVYNGFASVGEVD